MTHFPDWLKDFKAADPRQMLLRVAQFSQSSKTSQNDPVKVTLSLSNGQTMTGVIMSLERNKDGDYLLLASGDEATPILGFLRLDHVISVEVLVTPRLREALTPQPSLPFPKSGAPSRLQIRRAFETANLELEKVGIQTRVDSKWDSMGDSPEEGFVVNELLKGLCKLLPLIASEPVGKEALGSIVSVILRQKQDTYVLECEREGQSIFLIGDFKQPLRVDYQEDLGKMIGAAL